MGFSKIELKVKTLPHFKGELPRYETVHASGLDVRAALNEVVVLQPMARTMIPTGLSFEIPPGYEIQVRPRSGLAAKQGVTVLNTPGTVDADYRGEVKIILVNLGEHTVEIRDQDRIAQLVLCPVMQANLVVTTDLTETARGAGGFGSTGVRA
ncbi:MAG: dUTP diphosphatase [Bdellovibrionaceae bacterium]|nr:dUTP diphosphatase [Pseudobdellovibrionaceae bacterium]